MTFKAFRKNDRCGGAAMIMTIVALIALTLLGVFMLARTQSDKMVSDNNNRIARALKFATETADVQALRLVNTMDCLRCGVENAGYNCPTFAGGAEDAARMMGKCTQPGQQLPNDLSGVQVYPSHSRAAEASFLIFDQNRAEITDLGTVAERLAAAPGTSEVFGIEAIAPAGQAEQVVEAFYRIDYTASDDTITVPPPPAPVAVICAETAGVCVNPMANFARAGCIDKNRIGGVCDPAQRDNPEFEPAYIDGGNFNVPNCELDSSERLVCEDSVNATGGLPGVAAAAGTNVVFDRGLTVPPPDPRDMPYGGFEGNSPRIVTSDWKAFVEKILDIARSQPERVVKLETTTNGHIKRYCYGDKAPWGTPEDPNVIVVSGVAGEIVSIKGGVPTSTGNDCTFSGAGVNSNVKNHYLKGYGILLVDNVKFQTKHNFLFHGLVIVKGPQGSVRLDSSGTVYGNPRTTAVYGTVVMIDTLPDRLGPNPRWDVNHWEGDSAYHALVTYANSPRFRFSEAGYNFAQAALEPPVPGSGGNFNIKRISWRAKPTDQLCVRSGGCP